MKSLGVIALVGAALIAGNAWRGRTETANEPLLLFTSLPIYWGEASDLASALDGDEPLHWARRAIEESRPLHPVDTLDAASLRGRRDLLVIQPRPLSPAENVALDDWVAAGGRLLLFADPALTQASAFALGDRRRPQDTVLLSPILARWGLRLEFDMDQPAGEHAAGLGDGIAAPVDLPGRFVAMAGGRSDARCTIEAAALVADCRVGHGRVLALADAALFERQGDAARRAALQALMARAWRAGTG